MTEPRLVRYRLVVQYDGSSYHGWQLQPEAPTVQGELEAILERITGARRPVVGSGRTDRGVHARHQVASVDVPPRWNARTLRSALNALLPHDIWVQEVGRAPGDFHPRYDAVQRSYRYQVGTHPQAGSPFHSRWCWNLSESVDLPDPELLERAAELLPGERSFAAFAKAGQPARGERCRVYEAGWKNWTDLGYAFEITADRYLHRMVRYLVGTMMDVAKSRRPLADVKALLDEPGTELRTSPPAPPEGLFLWRVTYPPKRLGIDPDPDPEPEHTAQA